MTALPCIGGSFSRVRMRVHFLAAFLKRARGVAVIRGVEQAIMAREHVPLNPPLVKKPDVGPKLHAAGRFGEDVHEVFVDLDERCPVGDDGLLGEAPAGAERELPRPRR